MATVIGHCREGFGYAKSKVGDTLFCSTLVLRLTMYNTVPNKLLLRWFVVYVPAFHAYCRHVFRKCISLWHRSKRSVGGPLELPHTCASLRMYVELQSYKKSSRHPTRFRHVPSILAENFLCTPRVSDPTLALLILSVVHLLVRSLPPQYPSLFATLGSGSELGELVHSAFHSLAPFAVLLR